MMFKDLVGDKDRKSVVLKVGVKHPLYGTPNYKNPETFFSPKHTIQSPSTSNSSEFTINSSAIVSRDYTLKTEVDKKCCFCCFK